MKAAILMLGVLLSAGALRADQWSPLLHGIAAVETGDRALRGAAGERTRYQILPATWRRFSRAPMATASAAEVERVARCILREIDAQLVAQGCERTPFQYALRWNAGANARWFKPATWVYARQVQAMVEAQ